MKAEKKHRKLLSRIFPSNGPNKRDVQVILKENAPFIAKSEDIAEVIRHLMLQETPVRVQLPGSDDVFTTRFEPMAGGLDD